MSKSNGEGGERLRGCIYKNVAVVMGTHFWSSGQTAAFIFRRKKKSPARQQHKSCRLPDSWAL